MKILFLGVKWPAETFIQRLINGLLDANIEVGIVSKIKPETDWLSKSGFKWIPDIKVLKFKIKLFNPTKWDVIYFSWNGVVIENLPLMKQGASTVISCRGAQFNGVSHYSKPFSIIDGLKESFQLASKVHCASHDIEREALSLGLDTNKSVVITPAVDASFFRPLPSKQKNLSIKLVTTGSLIWRKGFEYLLMSVRKLLDQNVSLQIEIIGDGPEKQRMLHAIHDLRLESHVQLSGKLSPEQIRDRLQQADIFILSSLSEGISNAVLEAMACGLPIVTTDAGGMREAVTDEVEGFVVPVRNPDAMGEKIKLLIECPELRIKMGKAARARIEKDFRLEDQIARFVELFHQVATK